MNDGVRSLIAANCIWDFDIEMPKSLSSFVICQPNFLRRAARAVDHGPRWIADIIDCMARADLEG